MHFAQLLQLTTSSNRKVYFSPSHATECSSAHYFVLTVFLLLNAAILLRYALELQLNRS